MPTDTNLDRVNQSFMPVLASFEASGNGVQNREVTLEELLADDAFSNGAGGSGDLAKAANHLRSFADTHSAASFDFSSSHSDELRVPLSPLSSHSTAIDPALQGFPPLVTPEETGSLSPAIIPLPLSSSSAETSDDALASAFDSFFGSVATTADAGLIEPMLPLSAMLPALPDLLLTVNAVRASAFPRPKKPLPTSTSTFTPKPRDLLPPDAPIQPRLYLAPSKTSRKALPQEFAHRIPQEKVAGVKRELADGDSVNPEAEELARMVQPKIEIKREQNTMAARRSRQRKAVEKVALETQLEACQAELAKTKRHLEDAWAENGILREVMQHN